MADYPVYEPTRQCSICKGKCCKKMPGHYSPSDFSNLSFEALKAEIEKGNIAIDWWEATPREYYLRARHLGEDIVHGSWGGVCVNLAPWGCRLSWDERPFGCKALKPHEDKHGECHNSYSKEQCKNDWKEHTEVLLKLAEHFGAKKTTLEELMNSMAEAMDMFVGRCSDGSD